MLSLYKSIFSSTGIFQITGTFLEQQKKVKLAIVVKLVTIVKNNSTKKTKTYPLKAENAANLTNFTGQFEINCTPSSNAIRTGNNFNI